MTDDDRSRHDFKNQLAIIRGFAEILLAETDVTDPRHRDLQEILQSRGDRARAARPLVSNRTRHAGMTPAPERSSIQRVAHLSHELRGREWLLDERQATIEPRLLRGGLFGVA